MITMSRHKIASTGQQLRQSLSKFGAKVCAFTPEAFSCKRFHTARRCRGIGFASRLKGFIHPLHTEGGRLKEA